MLYNVIQLILHFIKIIDFIFLTLILYCSYWITNKKLKKLLFPLTRIWCKFLIRALGVNFTVKYQNKKLDYIKTWKTIERFFVRFSNDPNKKWTIGLGHSSYG